MISSRLLCLLFCLLLLSCNIFKKSSKVTNPDDTYQPISSDSSVFVNYSYNDEEFYPYRPSRTRTNDLLHTLLNLRFDYARQHVIGSATLTFKPWFYPVRTLELDAKGFDILKLKLLKQNDSMDSLSYEYDGMVLRINLDREYRRDEKYEIYIEYIAKPNEAPAGGGIAISGEKGLYFINPAGKEPGKPRQIWTQGETQSNSRWFPTIETPAEKMTQEIYLTVDTADETLSNGELVYSKRNNDGTRTDYWQLELPHAPYLAMIAVGNFAIINDSWRDSIEVNYYVEPEYARFAKMIFGNTPEMMEFFSVKFGVDFAWPKYSQIVVRDFVSGAMENTTAVTFYDKLQHDSLDHVDETNENVISHELFHHWFGDLVTAESWANLTLNESFATYGEYLWNEHKYGRDQADYGLQEEFETYVNSFNSNFGNQPTIINFHYETDEKMFNAHSYQKGGMVLHMLRKYVGDEAFFQALKNYLNKYRFGTAELSNLRMEFEELTGEDLNWFFNQWFLRSGHPELYVIHGWDSATGSFKVNIVQNQTGPAYELPVDIALYTADSVIRKRIRITGKNYNYEMKLEKPPLLFNFDTEKMLLGYVYCDKTIEEWAWQFEHAPLFADRHEALEGIKRLQGFAKENTIGAELAKKALTDNFWAIRSSGLNIMFLNDSLRKSVRPLLEHLALHDPSPVVRENAISLNESFNDERGKELLLKTINDSSYRVKETTLSALSIWYPEEAAKQARLLQNTRSSRLLVTVANIISKAKDPADSSFFTRSVKRSDAANRADLIWYYGVFLKELSPEAIIKNLKNLEEINNAYSDPETWLALYKVILELKDSNSARIMEIKNHPAEAGSQEQKDNEMRLLLLELLEKELLNEEKKYHPDGF